MNEVKQSDLIDIPGLKKVEDNVQNRINSDIGYLPIRLCTKGKLSVPEVLHFRYFNMNELLELSSVVEDEERMFTLIKCINNMKSEKDVLCEDMNEEELIDVLINLHFIYNSNELGPYNYHIDNTIKDEELLNKESNLGKISFTTKDLNIINIKDEFKEPINIKDKENPDIQYKFRFPRIKDALMAREYIMSKYKSEKEKFVELEWNLKYNENKHIKDHKKIDEDLMKEYNDYLKRIRIDTLKIREAYLLVGDKNKNFTIEESLSKIDNNEIPYHIWAVYNSNTEKYRFGIERKISFYCPVNKEIITRSFLFQPFDFIPDFKLQDDSKYDVSFGD